MQNLILFFIPSGEDISNRFSDLGKVLTGTAKGVSKAVRSSTPLPKVQDFRQDVDIFSELNRRQALSGNDPATQQIAQRTRR